MNFVRIASDGSTVERQVSKTIKWTAFELPDNATDQETANYLFTAADTDLNGNIDETEWAAYLTAYLE